MKKKSLINFLTGTIKCAIEQNRAQQRRLNVLIGQRKKSDYIKINLPKKYLIQLLKLLDMSKKKSITKVIHTERAFYRESDKKNDYLIESEKIKERTTPTGEKEYYLMVTVVVKAKGPVGMRGNGSLKMYPHAKKDKT